MTTGTIKVLGFVNHISPSCKPNFICNDGCSILQRQLTMAIISAKWACFIKERGENYDAYLEPEI